MNDLRAAIDAGEEDVREGQTQCFSGDEFATYLSERRGNYPAKTKYLKPITRRKVDFTDSAANKSATIPAKWSAETQNFRQKILLLQ